MIPSLFEQSKKKLIRSWSDQKDSKFKQFRGTIKICDLDLRLNLVSKSGRVFIVGFYLIPGSAQPD